MVYRKRNRTKTRTRKSSYKRHPKKKRSSRRGKTYKKSPKKFKRRMRGGSGVTLSNYSYSSGYSTGGIISSQNLGLANPSPHHPYAKCGGV